MWAMCNVNNRYDYNTNATIFSSNKTFLYYIYMYYETETYVSCLKLSPRLIGLNPLRANATLFKYQRHGELPTQTLQ